MNELPPKSTGLRKQLKKFDCGCEWEVALNEDGDIVGINYEPELANIHCKKVWELLASGLTKGIFQLETQLGQTTAKACKPYGISELSDVISCIRPGVGDSILDDKTLKQHYIDRKNGLEEPIPPHESLKEILGPTQGIIMYQEQAMKASQIIAGFSGEEANSLRKASGKKRVDLMEQIKVKFIDGAKKLGRVSEEDAELVFSIIEASQRYAFNFSHSVAYAVNALYFSAYAKSHFPKAFFLAELVAAKSIEEIGEVIDDSLNFKVEICKPDLRLLNDDFTLSNRCIQYGLGRIKGVGESKLAKLKVAIDGRNVGSMRWLDLLWCLSKTSSDAALSLIYSGALDFTLLTRSRMMFELSIFNRLTEKQQDYIRESNSLLSGLTSIVDMGSGKSTLCYNSASLKKATTILNELNSPPFSLKDSRDQIFNWEIQHLGYAFTTGEIDESLSNCTCQDFNDGKYLKNYIIAGTVVRIKVIETKGKEPGQEMAFVEFKDSTNKVSGVAFPQVWLENSMKIYEGNKLMFFGVTGKKNSFVINRVMQL